MKQIYPLGSLKHTSHGFTLIEILVAATAVIAILAGVGYGLVAVVQSKNTADAESAQRRNSSDALNYISNEVRSASAIDPSGNTSGISGFPTLPADSQVVLVLSIPSLPKPVVYYITAAQTPWMGPNTIVRWGPDINADGTYNTNSYNSKILVDTIDTSDSGSSCTGGWSAIPSITSRKGFYVCVDPTGKAADLYIGSVFTDGSGHLSSYIVNSRITARSS